MNLSEKCLQWFCEGLPTAVLAAVMLMMLYSCAIPETVYVKVPEDVYWQEKQMESCNELFAQNWDDLSLDNRAARSECDKWRESGYAR